MDESRSPLIYTTPHVQTHHSSPNSFFQVLIHLIVRAAKAAVLDPVGNIHAVRAFSL